MRKTLFAGLLIISLAIHAQERRIDGIPDIPGYLTLKCDFHMHTVFSDGLVWPTVRVDEAWREGLDAISITDHLEYLPHKEDIDADFNRSWQIATEYAEGKGIIVIPGTEITKSMPPGHLNAIFVKDANAILKDDFREAAGEAARQGAFIFWNHPGWKAQQPDTMKWWDEHTWLYEQGWMHGIEVANHHEHYPVALDWALERNLAVLANSDIHAPSGMAFDPDRERRTHTLVFATDRSAGAIREALFNGRTLACIGDLLLGKEVLMEAMLKAVMKINPIDPEKQVYAFENHSELNLRLKFSDRVYADWTREIRVKPFHETVLLIPPDTNPENLEIEVLNMLCGSGEALMVRMKALLQEAGLARH